MNEETKRAEIALPSGARMAFRLIEPGSFRMGERGLNPEYCGSSDPVHRVKIEHPFWLGETPVTQAQFAVWTRAAGVKHENHFPDTPERRARDWSHHPAENMDWLQASGFCQWLTEVCELWKPSEDFPEGAWACLPTEAEWEYACRAGTETEYYTGDGEAALAEAGWFGEEWGEGSTHSVALKQVNAFGLFDMHGNVWEWCHDLHDERAYCTQVDGVRDPGRALREADYRAERGFERSENAPRRVLRGGSWSFAARHCRAAVRSRFGAGLRFRNFGFRVCLVPGPCQTEQETARRAEPAPGDGGRGTSPESEGAGGARAGALHLADESFPRAAGTKNFLLNSAVPETRHPPPAHASEPP